MAFPETSWTLITAYQLADAGRRREALCKLLCRYDRPIQSYVRRFQIAGLESGDIAQDFLLSAIEAELFAAADRSKGSFRSLLVSAIRRHVSRLIEASQTQKRGEGAEHFPIEEVAIASESSPERELDVAWSKHIASMAIERLRIAATERGKAREFELLLPYLIEDPEPGDYDKVAAELGIRRNAVAVNVARLRNRFRNIVQEEVRDTCASEESAAEEGAALRDAIHQSA